MRAASVKPSKIPARRGWEFPYSRDIILRLRVHCDYSRVVLLVVSVIPKPCRYQMLVSAPNPHARNPSSRLRVLTAQDGSVPRLLSLLFSG